MTIPKYEIFKADKNKIMMAKGMDVSYLRKSHVTQNEWIPLKQSEMQGKAPSVYNKYSKGSGMNSKYF